ncbi:MAG: hypothetical protein BAJALOKI1v1_1100009 [Promethearchaeota archaeon]|nr:MAG: hypothetical protein BAJALOKI1v1_1100009 [Candidatus Lokiarchaeota archaeon]
MINKYISNILIQVEKLIKDEEYFLAGMKLMELAEVGIVIENKYIVTICTELADVLRNSFAEIEYFKKKYDIKMVEKTIEMIFTLLKNLNNYNKDYSESEKAEILNLMMDIIYNAEKIQYITKDIRIKKAGIIRRGPLL